MYRNSVFIYLFIYCDLNRIYVSVGGKKNEDVKIAAIHL